jgi:hypothetical protein
MFLQLTRSLDNPPFTQTHLLTSLRLLHPTRLPTSPTSTISGPTTSFPSSERRTRISRRTPPLESETGRPSSPIKVFLARSACVSSIFRHKCGQRFRSACLSLHLSFLLILLLPQPYLRSLTFNPDVLLNDDPKAELKDARKKWAAQTSDEIATNVSLLRIFPQSTPVHSTTHTPFQSNTPSAHTPASSRSPVQGRSPSLTRLGGSGGNEKSSDLPLKRITAPSTLATRRSGGAAAGIGGGLGMLARGRVVDRSLASLASSDITPRHHLSPLTQTASLPASPSMVASLLPDPLLSVPPSSASTTTFSSLQDLHFASEGPIKPFDASQPLIPYNDIPRDVVSSIVPPPYPQLVADRLSLRIAQVTPPASVPTATPVSITPTASSSSRSHPGLEPDGIGPALAGPSAGEVEARKEVEKLRREVFLLRNELSFEVYLKNRFVLRKLLCSSSLDVEGVVKANQVCFFFFFALGRESTASPRADQVGRHRSRSPISRASFVPP